MTFDAQEPSESNTQIFANTWHRRRIATWLDCSVGGCDNGHALRFDVIGISLPLCVRHHVEMHVDREVVKLGGVLKRYLTEIELLKAYSGSGAAGLKIEDVMRRATVAHTEIVAARAGIRSRLAELGYLGPHIR